jgi:hypothetical protein
MAKNRNTIGTVQITISTTGPVQKHLEQLVLTGLYGKNPAEAAERLVTQRIEYLLSTQIGRSLQANTTDREVQHG